MSDAPALKEMLNEACYRKMARDVAAVFPVADALKSHDFTGVMVLGGSANGAVSLFSSISAAIAPLVGGKPDNARGGGKDPSKLDEALERARALLS